jgi:hypothetical protein
MFLLLMKMLGFDIHGQIMTNIGCIDALWRQPELTVVAESSTVQKRRQTVC